jgi:hypothetical protein
MKAHLHRPLRSVEREKGGGEKGASVSAHGHYDEFTPYGDADASEEKRAALRDKLLNGGRSVEGAAAAWVKMSEQLAQRHDFCRRNIAVREQLRQFGRCGKLRHLYRVFDDG